jgi:hypothetical protein
MYAHCCGKEWPLNLSFLKCEYMIQNLTIKPMDLPRTLPVKVPTSHTIGILVGKVMTAPSSTTNRCELYRNGAGGLCSSLVQEHMESHLSVLLLVKFVFIETFSCNKLQWSSVCCPYSHFQVVLSAALVLCSCSFAAHGVTKWLTPQSRLTCMMQNLGKSSQSYQPLFLSQSV